MNELELLKKLDAAAQTGTEPAQRDSTGAVLRAIRVRSAAAQADSHRPMWWAAIVSAAAAAAVLFVAVQNVSQVDNPFGDLLTPMKTTLQ